MFLVPTFGRSGLDLIDDDSWFDEMGDLMTNPMRYIKPSDLQMELPTIKNNKFNFDLNMKDFDPSDISIKMDQNALVVKGKREVSGDNGSYEYREFSRVCSVPENVQSEQLKCKMDQDSGMLRIEAPLKDPKELKGPRTIPIEFSHGKSRK